jgi:hypothetical protein
MDIYIRSSTPRVVKDYIKLLARDYGYTAERLLAKYPKYVTISPEYFVDQKPLNVAEFPKYLFRRSLKNEN